MPTRKQKAQLDKLAAALKGVSPARLESFLAKEARIDIRVSATDKADIQRTAKAARLTTSEYLLRLHYFAAGRIFGKKR